MRILDPRQKTPPMSYKLHILHYWSLYMYTVCNSRSSELDVLIRHGRHWLPFAYLFSAHLLLAPFVNEQQLLKKSVAACGCVAQVATGGNVAARRKKPKSHRSFYSRCSVTCRWVCIAPDWYANRQSILAVGLADIPACTKRASSLSKYPMT